VQRGGLPRAANRKTEWASAWRPGPEPPRPSRPGYTVHAPGAATGRSLHTGHAPWCGLPGEDEESPGSAPEAATLAGCTGDACRQRGGSAAGNNGVRSSTTAAWHSAVVGGDLQNRRENGNEEGVNSRRGAREDGAHRGRQWRRHPLQNPTQRGRGFSCHWRRVGGHRGGSGRSTTW
jgi:hypothetical protein